MNNSAVQVSHTTCRLSLQATPRHWSILHTTPQHKALFVIEADGCLPHTPKPARCSRATTNRIRQERSKIKINQSSKRSDQIQQSTNAVRSDRYPISFLLSKEESFGQTTIWDSRRVASVTTFFHCTVRHNNLILQASPRTCTMEWDRLTWDARHLVTPQRYHSIVIKPSSKSLIFSNFLTIMFLDTPSFVNRKSRTVRLWRDGKKQQAP